MKNFRTKLNDIIVEILLITDEVTESQLYSLAIKLQDDGFTDETIIEEFKELKRRLLQNAK